MDIKSPFLSCKDNYIYHYTSTDILIKYILPQKQLRFSKINSTNDPEETRFHVMQYHDDLNLGPNFIRDKLEKTITISRGITEHIKLLCFSQDDDSFDISNGLFSDKGFARPRMWAQYAQNHRGVCLVFDKEKLIEKFNSDFEYYLHFCDDVSYDPIIKQLSLPEYEYAQIGLASELQKSAEQIIEDRIKKYHKIYYFSKHKDWQTEKEFRFVIRDEIHSETFLSIDGTLAYIILGHNCESQLTHPINILLQTFSKKPEILKFRYNGNSYSFEYK